MAHVRPELLLAVIGLAAAVSCAAGDDAEPSDVTGAAPSTVDEPSAATAATASGVPAPSTTIAAASTVPEPTDPSLPATGSGPRPPVVEAPVAMTFDAQSGLVVALVADETWVLDVESLTWTQQSDPPAELVEGSYRDLLVYHPASDRTIAVALSGATYLYDADRDVWEERSSMPTDSPELVAMDTDGGDLIAFARPADGVHDHRNPWSYSVSDDVWTALLEVDEDRPLDWTPGLVAYVPTVRAVVTLTGPSATRLFDPERGSWTTVDTDTPNLMFTFGDLSAGTEIAYAAVTDRVVVTSRGVTAEYDPIRMTWGTYPMPGEQVDDMDVGPLVRLGATLVYDSLHERVLMYGGAAAMPDGWTLLDDLWQYDPTTHEWTRLLDATQIVVSS